MCIRDRAAAIVRSTTMVNSQFFNKELHFLAMMDSHQIETGVTAAGPSPGIAFSRFTYTPAATKLW